MADGVFVAVDGGTIQMPVAGFEGSCDSGGDLFGGNLIGAEGAKADGGHGGAGAECALRNQGRLDVRCLDVTQGTSVMPSFT